MNLADKNPAAWCLEPANHVEYMQVPSCRVHARASGGSSRTSNRQQEIPKAEGLQDVAGSAGLPQDQLLAAAPQMNTYPRPRP